MNIQQYDTDAFPFEPAIRSLFDVADLSKIHETWKSDYPLFDDVKTDQLSPYHSRFYDGVGDTVFLERYAAFIRELIRPAYDEPILYQKMPTFRIHLPGNISVAAFHRDKDYSHSEHEVNVFLPMTEAYGNNTVWTESEPDKGDFSPIEGDYGDYITWDGANCKHGNNVNDTGRTRISVDFRILPLSRYEETEKVSVTVGTKMTLGSYFLLCD